MVGVLAKQVAADGQAGHKGRGDNADGGHGRAKSKWQVLGPQNFVNQGTEAGKTENQEDDEPVLSFDFTHSCSPEDK